MTTGRAAETEGGQAPNIPEIKFLHEGREISVTIPQFNALFTDIARFNSRFSMPSIMSSLFVSLIRDQEEPTKLDEQTQQLTAAGIGLIHHDVLDKSGLEIEPVSGKRGRLYTRTGQIDAGEIRINIREGRRFLGFLQAIVSQTIADNLDMRGNLENLSGVLAQQIFDHYDLREPSNEALQLLGSLEGIVGEYKRLGISSGDRLETYLTHSKKGDLREFLLVEQRGLLSEPGKYFGPADWQKDVSPEYLARRWNEALEALTMARDNPNAQDLYRQLFDHLSMCLRLASEDLEKPPRDEGHKEYKDKLKPVLQEVKQAFG